MMSRILKKLKDFVKWIPEGNHVIWHRLDERRKVYPFRFMNKAEQGAHERKLDLDLIATMYE